MEYMYQRDWDKFKNLEIVEWFIVANKWDGCPDGNCWTISPDSKKAGWETDSAQDGYGLPRNVAEFIVNKLNKR